MEIFNFIGLSEMSNIFKKLLIVLLVFQLHASAKNDIVVQEKQKKIFSRTWHSFKQCIKGEKGRPKQVAAVTIGIITLWTGGTSLVFAGTKLPLIKRKMPGYFFKEPHKDKHYSYKDSDIDNIAKMAKTKQLNAKEFRLFCYDFFATHKQNFIRKYVDQSLDKIKPYAKEGRANKSYDLIIRYCPNEQFIKNQFEKKDYYYVFYEYFKEITSHGSQIFDKDFKDSLSQWVKDQPK